MQLTYRHFIFDPAFHYGMYFPYHNHRRRLGKQVRLPVRSALPVIIFSVYDSSNYDIKETSGGYYVVKSYDLTELKTVIQGALVEAEVLFS